MPSGVMRPVDRKRWQRKITRHVEEFPRQYAAFESAMAAFGGNFDLQQFKKAFNTKDDMKAYNRVQAVERSAGRVQNFVAELAIAGASLAELQQSSTTPQGSEAQQAFDRLCHAKVINGHLRAELARAQHARTRIEHSYVDMPAGDVHHAVRLIHETARAFLERYRDWIAPFLERGNGDNL